ncbi:MAG TPA: dihydrofolate reductase family protein [Chryseolinea sp.]|nr:dihydrofolate reductase family protein [Chryseolinea sp.]
MRKVVLFMHLSLDGFAAGPNGELDFLSYDGELAQYASELVKTVGSPVYGRTTYQLMESYWPTILTKPDAGKHELEHAQWVENVPKIVFSKTLNEVTWNNTRLIKDNISEEVKKLKQQPGKDLVIFGSPGLAATFMNLGLIDEYKLTVHPVVLSNGINVFKSNTIKSRLKLLDTKTLKSGVVTLHYETIH